MAKSNRGKGTKEFFNRGRATCPVCKRTGIKTIYELEVEDKKLTVCKQCKKGISNGKLKNAVANL